MVDHIERGAVRGQVNQAIAAANARHKLAKITRIGDNELRPVRRWWASRWRYPINTHNRMALLDQKWDQRAAELAATASYRNSHYSLTFHNITNVSSCISCLRSTSPGTKYSLLWTRA